MSEVIKSIPVGQILTDPTYQRPLNTSRVRKIIKNYDERQVRQAVVSIRQDGRYFVIDGQHTISALKQMFGAKHTISCKCLTGLSKEEEAKMFYEMNSNAKLPTFSERIKALRESGDEEVNEYFKTIEEVGIPYSLSNHNTHNCGLVSHNKAFLLFKNYDRALFTSTLRIAYLSLGNDGLESQIIVGFGLFLKAYPQANVSRLATRLNGMTGQRIKTMSAVYGNFGNFSGTSLYSPPIASVLVDIYNKGLKSGKLDKSALINA